MKSLRCGFLLFVVTWILPCVAPAQTGSVVINITAPATNAVVGDVLPVNVIVSSTYEVTSVRVQIQDRAEELVFNYPGWSTTISLAGLPRGDKTLTITARDVFGNTATAQRTLLLDRPPLLRIEEPTSGTVIVNGGVDVRLSATDDSPGDVTLTVGLMGRVGVFHILLTGTNSLVGRLTNFDPCFCVWGLWFGATDSLNQKSWFSRDIGSDPGSNVTEIARFDGPILDLSAGAVLYSTNADSRASRSPYVPELRPSTQGVAVIRSRLTGSERRLSLPGYIPYSGRLINDDGAMVFLRMSTPPKAPR